MPNVLKSGSLTLPETSGPLQACNAISCWSFEGIICFRNVLKQILGDLASYPTRKESTTQPWKLQSSQLSNICTGIFRIYPFPGHWPTSFITSSKLWDVTACKTTIFSVLHVVWLWGQILLLLPLPPFCACFEGNGKFLPSTCITTDLEYNCRRYFSFLSLKMTNLMHNSFSCMFISILYMFRAAMCPSSGELIVSVLHLVYVTLYRWPFTKRSSIQGDIYQM